MEFIATKKTLLGALKTIRGAVANKSTLPILMNIILEAKDNTLELVATDLDISIETQVSTNIVETGSCTIPAQKLRRLVNELPSDETRLHFQLRENQAELTVEEIQSEFQMPVLDRDEYPSLPRVEEGRTFKVNSNTLSHLLDHSTFAAGTDTSRSYLCGVYFDLDETQLTMVATDAHRLALHRSEIPEHEADGLGLLVPTNACKELTKILRDQEDDEIQVTTDEQLIEFKAGNTRMVSRLIDEDFPNYDQVIPDDYEKRVGVNRDRLLDAVRRVSLMADEKTRRLLLELEDDHLTVHAETSEEGGGEEVVDVDYSGEPITVAFNGDYLQAVLNHIEDEDVYFDLISEDSPGTFRPMDSDGYLYIIMPLRLN